jgi:alpha-beta hydrolase superfamily lysophospholipase
MLLISGEIDHVVPPAIVEALTKKYQKSGSPAIVEYKTYPGRTHRLVSQSGWEEIADDALAWATSHAATETA